MAGAVRHLMGCTTAQDARREPQLPEKTCPRHPTNREFVCHGPWGLPARDALEARMLNCLNLVNAPRAVSQLL